jgi:hypothetical protein
MTMMNTTVGKKRRLEQQMLWGINIVLSSLHSLIPHCCQQSLTNQRKLFMYSCYPQPLPGGLQSNKSPASVLHGPTSLSTTGLGNSISAPAGGDTLVSTCRLCVLLNFRLGSVRLINASNPLLFFFFGSSVTAVTVDSSTRSVASLEVFARLRFSQSSAALGIGASFSLLTRLKFLLGDFPALVIFEPSSIGSARTLARLFGFWRRDASSVVLIMRPFLFARRGCGGRATGSLRGGKAEPSSIVVVEVGCFLVRFAGRLGIPPVERGTLRGEVEGVRDRASDASVCTGDTSLDTGIGGSSAGMGGDGTLCAGAGFSTVLFRDCAFRTVSFDGGDFGLAVAGLSDDSADIFFIFLVIVGLDWGTFSGGEEDMI